jgi:hypothetical protein
MSSASAKGPPPPHEPSILAGVLSYLIPGLGQLYQGRYGKGLLFMVSLLGMFMLGQALGQWQNVYLPRHREGMQAAPGIMRYFLGVGLWNRLQFAGQFWIGVSAWPAIYHFYETPPKNEVDLPFWRTYQTEPDEAKVNEFLVNSDKTPDLGWVYTVIAGMLNILVIYDAYAGPLIYGAARSPTKETVVKTEAQPQGAA